MRALLALTMLLAAGCSQQQLQPVSPVVGLEGPPAYKLRCPYEAECAKRAESLCPGGYATLSNDDGIYGVTKVVQCR
jgi:hypothetical protein